MQVGFEKLSECSKGNFARDVVIEIDVVCARDNHQRFLFTADRLKGIFGKIALMGLFAGHNKRRNSHFAGVTQQRHIHKRQRHRRIPSPG